MKKNILTTEQASFLKQYNFSLYQERFEVLCEAQKARKRRASKFCLGR